MAHPLHSGHQRKRAKKVEWQEMCSRKTAKKKPQQVKGKSGNLGELKRHRGKSCRKASHIHLCKLFHQQIPNQGSKGKGKNKSHASHNSKRSIPTAKRMEASTRGSASERREINVKLSMPNLGRLAANTPEIFCLYVFVSSREGNLPQRRLCQAHANGCGVGRTFSLSLTLFYLRPLVLAPPSIQPLQQCTADDTARAGG